uniref:hypothetical protein n=1 Tax=uncultured Allobacillus sp. TaxID=1638025 RepID=UPI0025985ED7|nr:hypothetical protein [uncultured Allobacillus sp.]
MHSIVLMLISLILLLTVIFLEKKYLKEYTKVIKKNKRNNNVNIEKLEQILNKKLDRDEINKIYQNAERPFLKHRGGNNE